MYPFIVVNDGAYGISFDIVMADTPHEAYCLSNNGGSSNWELCVIDLRDYANRRNEVVYTEQPTGG